MAVTGGNDWNAYYFVMDLMGSFYPAVFLIYTFFFIFAPWPGSPCAQCPLAPSNFAKDSISCSCTVSKQRIGKKTRNVRGHLRSHEPGLSLFHESIGIQKPQDCFPSIGECWSFRATCAIPGQRRLLKGWFPDFRQNRAIRAKRGLDWAYVF